MLRYYPGDALVEIKQEDLEKIANQHKVHMTVNITLPSAFTSPHPRNLGESRIIGRSMHN
jgi:hypothetical protein